MFENVGELLPMSLARGLPRNEQVVRKLLKYLETSSAASTRLARVLLEPTSWYAVVSNDASEPEAPPAGVASPPLPVVQAHVTLLCTIDPIPSRQTKLYAQLDPAGQVVGLSTAYTGVSQTPLRIQRLTLTREPRPEGDFSDIAIDMSVLDLSAKGLRDTGLALILEFARQFTQCRFVNLAGNLITGVGPHAEFLRALVALPHIRRVDVTGNPMSRSFEESLSEELEGKLIWDSPNSGLPAHVIRDSVRRSPLQSECRVRLKFGRIRPKKERKKEEAPPVPTPKAS
eukprot:c19725_g1_i1.p1 GENE.c19725_g1_i1~~c19725_g1_i1.p1  ORF type:complete len:286 (-),score=52.19 c19725_g1_i1:462-1319(-)